MIVTIKNKQEFMRSVFGAESFVEYWPELETSGVTVRKESNGHYYILDECKPHTGNDTAFFTEEELEYLTIV